MSNLGYVWIHETDREDLFRKKNLEFLKIIVAYLFYICSLPLSFCVSEEQCLTIMQYLGFADYSFQITCCYLGMPGPLYALFWFLTVATLHVIIRDLTSILLN